jgi:hypothetical protein
MIFKSHEQKKNHLKTKEKALRKEKVQRTIVESLYLSTMPQIITFILPHIPIVKRM